MSKQPIDVSKLEIRPAYTEDKDYLVKFLMQKGVLPFFPMCDLREVEDSARISFTYIDQGSIYTAEYDGQVCGFTVLYVSPFTKLKHQSLFMIVVDEDYRGRGIGSKMIDHLVMAAQEDHGIELLHLEVYENNPARALYERKGFIEYGRHPKFLKEEDGTFRDKILMQRKLGEA